ncbi:HAD family hydrolase [Bacillus suaedae]|uniref:HAD family hydrolase n=1 Tax=Halalkalibacter suaedae TaxID=2822140 RepID=A0A940WX02_9BACI|nr:HAD family hydrolase [Bacillus suaedae]MBP3953243.1 HAD family hydrolase [Bacillus suaedae]
MTEIKGVLFDKDGTLIEFLELWRRIAFGLVTELVPSGNASRIREALLESIGLLNGEVQPTSILASGTTKDIATAFYPILIKERQSIPEPFHLWVEERILLLTKQNLDAVKPVTDLRTLLQKLKRKGLKIGVATADDIETTNLTFKLLGIDQLFDFVGTSDQYKKKPDPSMMKAFCQSVNLEPDQIVMVGDTAIDIAFAKNSKCGLSIGVKSGASQIDDLIDADYIIPSVKFLINDEDHFVWS